MFDITELNCPKVAVDAVVRLNGTNNLVLIERKFAPFGMALPGGFVDYGESCEIAVTREVKEEMGLRFQIGGQLRSKSDPDRDPRGHIMTIPFWGIAEGEPKAQDDAKGIYIISRTQVLDEHFAFKDHKDIILEYIFTTD